MKRIRRTCIVTGGNSGLGYQLAKNIAKYDKDYHIIIACRNQEKSRKAAEKLIADTGRRWCEHFARTNSIPGFDPPPGPLRQ